MSDYWLSKVLEVRGPIDHDGNKRETPAFGKSSLNIASGDVRNGH